MAPKGRDKTDPDRFIVKRGETYHYKRRVPLSVVDLDSRAPHVRTSLKTSSLVVARQTRDALEAADDAFWGSLLGGEVRQVAQMRYDAAVRRAEALGFGYKPIEMIAAGPIEDYVQRLEATADPRTPKSSDTAVLGLVTLPTDRVSDALRIYIEDIAPSQLLGKSEEQKRQWRKIPKRAVENFIFLCGDLPMPDVAREHALKIYDFWNKRIAPPQGEVATHSASSGNRELGSLRVIYREYYKRMGDRDRKNPFDELSFSELRRTRRPPFPVEWIVDVLLRPGAFELLNSEARGIFLTIIETGARPSEIANLDRSTIILDADIPHISIQPREDPDDPRDTKTESSIRLIPLVGVSLAAMKAHPDGFPRYRNREIALSSVLNKHLKTRGLLPTPKHSVYSLRHSFEDRLKNAHVDSELRMLLMGHLIERPQYGEGGSLQWRLDGLKKIELPFDPVIV